MVGNPLPPVEPVLVIDSSDAHRGLIASVLEYAGFRVCTVPDLAAAADLLQQFPDCVVVRELNLAPGQCKQSLEQLLSAPEQLLRRTVIATTAAERALKSIGPERVFAVIGKPFDIEVLVEAVRGCAASSRDRAAAAAAVAAPPADFPRRPTPGSGGGEVVKIETIRQFMNRVPSLQRLLSGPIQSAREALVRTELRRIIGALSTVLDEGAAAAASPPHAAVLRAASREASRLVKSGTRDPHRIERGH